MAGTAQLKKKQIYPFILESYGLGAILILSCAAITAVGQVNSAQSKTYGCPNVWLMVSAGFATLAVSGFAPLINMENRYLNK